MPLSSRLPVFACLALFYAATAIPAAWNTIAASEASAQARERILELYSLKNEGALALDRFGKDHPILSTLFAPTVKGTLELPSREEASEALHSEVPRFLKTVRQQSSAAAWWSWFLLNASLAYVIAVVVLERSFLTRPVFFALTGVCLVFFVIGVLAPAMVIWTAPSIPMATGNLEFVLQHEVRGIAAIIRELFSSGHWIIGGFLFLFSIVTPLTKASLTFFVTASRSRALNFRIGQVLHAIGKWSMADVFVAGVLLALYALKFQEATKSVACLGLFYFIGYCLLSMTTTELLMHSRATGLEEPQEQKEPKPERKLGTGAIRGLCALLLCFFLGSSFYVYGHYTLKERAPVSSSPQRPEGPDPDHK